MKKLSLFLIAFSTIASLRAQMNPTGKYRLVEGKFETITGKYVDFLKEEYEKDPCLANVIFHFVSGQIITTADNCPDSTRKKLFGPELAVKWELTTEGKIIVSTKDDYIDPMTFDIKVYRNSTTKGKEMRWETMLEIDPKDPNPEKARKLIFVYREH